MDWNRAVLQDTVDDSDPYSGVLRLVVALARGGEGFVDLFVDFLFFPGVNRVQGAKNTLKARNKQAE